jgi:drug/metabolite transporter (DMT)-like permease
VDDIKKSYIELHIAVLLFGLTAILGDLISLSATVLVWWRVLLASMGFIFIINLRKTISVIPRKFLWEFIIIGFLIGIHWICFFGSIKFANASIALICMATTAFFTSILEPIIFRKKIKILEIFLGIIIIPAMILIVNAIDINMKLGFWIGIFAALLASIFAIWNKKLISVSDSMTISFIELSSAFILLSLILPVYFLFQKEENLMPTGMDWIYLLILALLCTTFAYALSLKVLNHLSAFASNLVINLEPIYGIILAIIILKEHKELNWEFFVGAAIILSSIFCYPFLKKKFYKDE